MQKFLGKNASILQKTHYVMRKFQQITKLIIIRLSNVLNNSETKCFKVLPTTKFKLFTECTIFSPTLTYTCSFSGICQQFFSHLHSFSIQAVVFCMPNSLLRLCNICSLVTRCFCWKFPGSLPKICRNVWRLKSHQEQIGVFKSLLSEE